MAVQADQLNYQGSLGYPLGRLSYGPDSRLLARIPRLEPFAQERSRDASSALGDLVEELRALGDESI